MRTLVTSLVLLVTLDSVARGNGALDETSAGNTEQSSLSPEVTWFADKISGFWDASDHWQLRADFTETHEYTVTPGSSGLGVPGDVMLATMSAEYDPDDQVSIRAVVGWSPSSTTASAATVPLKIMGTTQQADVGVSSTAASESGALWLGLDTASDRFTTSFTAVVTFNEFQMQQQVDDVLLPDGTTMTGPQLSMYCTTNTCPQELKGALAAQPASFGQLELEGNLSQTLWKDTDLGIDAAYYQYTQDPTQVGYFATGALGRTTAFGGGAGIAPYLWTVMPDVIHRFGQLMVLASVFYGQYVDNEGTDLTAALRVQYKFKVSEGHRLKLYAKVTGSIDTDSSNDTSNSASAALGAQYTW